MTWWTLEARSSTNRPGVGMSDPVKIASRPPGEGGRCRTALHRRARCRRGRLRSSITPPACPICSPVRSVLHTVRCIRDVSVWRPDGCPQGQCSQKTIRQ
jgi:hypothetical protein